MSLKITPYREGLSGDFSDSWDQKIKNLGGNIFHSFHWSLFSQADKPGSEIVFVELEDQTGKICSLSPIFLRKSSIPILGKLRSTLQFDTTPCTLNDKVTLDFLNQLRDNFGSFIAKPAIQLGSFYAQSKIRPLGSNISRKRIEFAIELNEEAIEKKFSSRRKRQLNKSKKSGLEFMECDFEEGFSTLCRLQGRSNQRIAGRGGPSLAAIQESSREKYSKFFNSGLFKFLGAKKNSSIEGLVLVSFFAGKAYYHQACHSDIGFASGSPTFLVKEAIELARSEGILEFNLGGTGENARDADSPEHGLWEFKKSFGSDELELADLNIPRSYLGIKTLAEKG